MTHDVEVLIIGAGMSGLGMAVQLIRQYGTRSFELIENSTEIGGTWWLNSYPGSGCDVSFEPLFCCDSFTNSENRFPLISSPTHLP